MNVSKALSIHQLFGGCPEKKVKYTNSYHGFSIFLLELPKLASIYNAGNDIPHVKWLADISSNNPMQFRRWV